MRLVNRSINIPSVFFNLSNIFFNIPGGGVGAGVGVGGLEGDGVGMVVGAGCCSWCRCRSLVLE